MNAIDPTGFFRVLALLIAAAAAAVLFIPALTNWLACWLHAHAVAMSAWYKVTRAAARAYRRIHTDVMERALED